MAIGTTAALLGGGALLGGLGGLVSGLAGTPDQKAQQTSSTQLGAMTPEQQQMQQQSLAQYLQQINQANQYEQGIGAAQGMQQQARDAYGNILGGQAFQMTPQEMANVQNLRNAMVQQGMQDVNQAMEQGSMLANRSAAGRGLRGQAQQQMQGDVMRAGAQQAGALANQANVWAGNQAINLPYQRIGAQSPFVQQGMGLADMMRLQAMQNRQNAQSPFLMQMLNQNRIAGATQTGNTTQFGQPGSLLAGLGGMMSGAAGGLGTAGNLMSGIGQFNQGQAMMNRYGR